MFSPGNNNRACLVQRPGHDHVVPGTAVEMPSPDGEATYVPPVPYQRRTQGKLGDVVHWGAVAAGRHGNLRGGRINSRTIREGFWEYEMKRNEIGSKETTDVLTSRGCFQQGIFQGKVRIHGRNAFPDYST